MTNIDINHLCRLAKLALNDTELRAVRRDLDRIIAMVDQMQAMDTHGVEPLAHPLDVEQRLRPDEITEKVDRERYQEGAPTTRDGLYLVPRVVE
ncbi:MAG: Asp-tRNA(Asn)/Glu-tRNA(Gln) amidotransferase subunit GatC [Gammaproteobacteria bacterium]|nr:Asp-tRNA(Asn)/Glu-tRNA(Gln) amidotransferase subunit GatC [Gammaproteobacteria bacterium]